MHSDTPTTHRSWIIWGLVALVVLGLLAWLLWPAPPKTASPTPSLSLPNAGPGDHATSTAITVAGKLGRVTVIDFIHNGTTAADPQNPGAYYLAGSPCVGGSYPGCPEGARETDFSVAYDAKPQFFTITLLTEPIGAARQGAEQFMMNALGVSQGELCTLNYYVGTTYYINQQYAGRNLGFASCPNATVLPQ